MLRDEENYVALFIDWDNLAISTAADFGGAAPDVRAIVRVAQRFGTILLARAYAEWQVPSDRLSVYRSGVDPIYAPTFRFEPDPVGGPARGKSLADPCLVADCIDMLHLMPTISHFVLVSGDKDLIPIVRIVQLRGRKVVVVGPDYVAAILRDMADEYISYRSLVESGETHSTPEQVQAGAAGPRRRGGRPVSTNRALPAPAPVAPPAPAIVAPPVVQPAPIQPPPPVSPPSRREQFRERGGQSFQPRQPAIEAAVPRYSEIEPEAPSEAPEMIEAAPMVDVPADIGGPALDAPSASPEELAALWSTIGQILKEREDQGKPRLRATNLKDLLMARVTGFSERRYGFGKFRDLLAAAESAGAAEVNRSGPVHWVTLPRQRDEASSEVPAAPAPSPAPSPTPVAAAPVAPAAVEPPASEEQPATPAPAAVVDAPEADLDLVRFVVDLRNRSRWLTYTYVLTNMIAHLSQRIQPQQADVEARNALNRLVQQGVLRVDREPREIEVAGARHRVRMCHLEESHPLVQSVLAEEGKTEVTATPVAEERVVPEPAPVRQPEREAPESRERREPRDRREPQQPREAREPRERQAPRGGRPQQPPRVILPFLQPSTPQRVEEPAGEPGQAGEVAETPAESVAEPRVTAAPVVPAAPARPASGLSPLPDVLLQSTTSAVLAPVNPTGTSASPVAVAAEPAAEAPASAPAAVAAPADEKSALVQAFEALREVIQGATGPDKQFAGAASVKTRLARRLGSFDERSLGFGKFKDFLIAAQRAGYVRVESNGPATRISLP